MTDTQRPWDRLTTESDPAYEACAAYLEPGSLRDAYRQRSGNEKATLSHRRDSQSASRHAERLREHLIQPGVLERHQVRALYLRLAPKFLQLRCHVVPGCPGRNVLDLLHGPFDADAVRVRILPRAILGQLLGDGAVGCPRQAVSHSRQAAHSEAFYLPLGPGWQRPDGGLTLPRGRSWDLSTIFTGHGVTSYAGLSGP